MCHRNHAYNRNIDKRQVRHMAWIRKTIATLYIRLIVANFDMQFKYLHGCCIKRLTVQLEYFDGLVASTHLIKLGRIRVISGSDPHYYLGQWVIRVSDGDPVATLV